MKKTIVTLVLIFALAAPVYAYYSTEPVSETPTEVPEIPIEVPETPSTLPETPTEPVSETPTETGGGQFIIVPINGKCPEDYLLSEDNKRCIKLIPPSPIPEFPYEKDISPTESKEGRGYVILPKDGKCPDGYTLRGDGKVCVKPPVPTIFIAPKEGFKEVIFNPGENVIIKDKNINEEIVVAPKEGFKVIISVESEGEKQAMAPQDVTIQSGVKPGIITLSIGQAFASTKEPIQIKENKIFLKEKEIKIMPDVASEIATEKLEGLGFDIELKDVGIQGIVQPVYEAVAVRDVKILGLFKAKMRVSTEIDAQTGEASEIKRPWWSFLVR